MNAVFPYDPLKATESAAEFIRLAGGKIPLLKLVKLMYLLDRESMRVRGVPVAGGRYLSMKHGPVTSEVLDAINRKNGYEKGFWEAHISARDGNCEVAVTDQPEGEHLSPFEIRLIGKLHEEHRTKDQYQLRDWCHDNCKEWHKPHFWEGGSPPIVVKELASGISRTPNELEDAANEAFFMAKVFAA